MSVIDLKAIQKWSILKGKCKKCGKDVARLIEDE